MLPWDVFLVFLNIPYNGGNIYKLYPTGDNLADQNNFAQPEDNLAEPVDDHAENPKLGLRHITMTIITVSWIG